MNGDAPEHEFSPEQMVAAMFAAKGIKSGLWRLAAQLRFAGITAAFPDEKGAALTNMPTGMVGIQGLALFSVDKPGPLVFDAAQASIKVAARKARASGGTSGGQMGKPSPSKARRGP